MRSLKATLLAASAAAAVCCAASFAAQANQDKPQPQNPQNQQPPQKGDKGTAAGGAVSAKDIVVLDASSQLSQLKDQKSGAGKKVASAPINLAQATGYRQGLDIVAFRLSGTIDKADGKSTPPAEGEPKNEGQPTAGGSEKGSGTVILQAIVSPRPDLTYDEVMRIINRGADKAGAPAKDGATPSPTPGADTAGAAILCECRTSTMTSASKGRTFEVVGFAPAEGGRFTTDLMGDVKRRLTETSASAKADPANPGATVGSTAAEPKPQDVKQALDLIEKGKAYLYVNLMPEMATGKGEHDMGAMGDTGGCTLKDISLVFAAVPKSAP